MQKVTKEEFLAKAKKPAEDAMKLHSFYHGKMQIMPKCQVRGVNDFAIYYTPGVAEPCRAIQTNEGRSLIDGTPWWLTARAPFTQGEKIWMKRRNSTLINGASAPPLIPKGRLVV